MTRIPINKSLPCEKSNFRKASVFLPIIGLIIGSIEWVIYYLLSKILPIECVIVIIILVGIVITGGLHVDGLGDTCDGFYAFKGKDKIIEIMKDSRIGTYACAAIVLDIILKYTLYCNAVLYQNSFIIIAVPIIGRFSITFLAYIGKNAKKTGSGNLFIENIGHAEMIITLCITAFFSILLLDVYKAAVIVSFSAFISILFNRYCISKINGITGDSLGANNEIVEILSLIVFEVFIR